MISIHAPPRGGRHSANRLLEYLRHFNPRPPARGATLMEIGSIIENLFQSTPPREGGDRSCLQPLSKSWIFQSTPPREGGDLHGILRHHAIQDFNPRPPARGATKRSKEEKQRNIISIHAPPRGGRQPQRMKIYSTMTHFNPRPPARGATMVGKCKPRPLWDISIHAPPRGGRLLIIR